MGNEEYMAKTFQIIGLKFLPEFWIPPLENPNAITNQHYIEDHSLNLKKKKNHVIILVICLQSVKIYMINIFIFFKILKSL